MNGKKSSTNGSIPSTILKQRVNIYLPFLTKAINLAITENIFPGQLKKSGVFPLYKKEDPLKKKNCRPVSLLPHISKIFERIIYKQIHIYMQDKLSKHWISKILWSTTFFNAHARKMDKKCFE